MKPHQKVPGDDAHRGSRGHEDHIRADQKCKPEEEEVLSAENVRQRSHRVSQCGLH